MNQKRNKIIVLSSLVFILGIIVWTIFISKNSINYTVSIVGDNPDLENSSLGVSQNSVIPLDGFLVQITDLNTKNVYKKITGQDGKVIFKLKKNKIYSLQLIPQTTLNSLYDLSQVSSQFGTALISGNYIKEIRLNLKEEAKRDMMRRQHLLIYQIALENYKIHRHAYPLAKEDNLFPQSTTYKRLEPYLDKNIIPIDPLPHHYYKYSSDGQSYLLIAFPEIDTRSILNIVKEYQGQKVYLLGDINLNK